MKKLYLWAQYGDGDAGAALKAGLINEVQAHCIEFKRPMLNPSAFVWVSLLCFAIWGLLHMEAQLIGPRTGCGFPRYHARVDQAV